MPTTPSPRIVVLNGGSSSGKSSITRALQESLPGTWLTFGVDEVDTTHRSADDCALDIARWLEAQGNI